MRPDRFPPYFIFAMMLFCLVLLLLLFEGMGSTEKEKRERMQSPYDPFYASHLTDASLFEDDTQSVDRHPL